MNDRNDLGFWFPLVRDSGLPVPATRIVRTDLPLYDLLDGVLPESDWWPFIGKLQEAAADLTGPPWFLRTGHGSGKHRWDETCYLPALTTTVLGSHASALVEWSAMAGLPVATWAVREFVPTDALFTCRAWGNFPVTREARLFVRDGNVEDIYPYWPAEALVPGDPDRDDWRDVLARASRFDSDEQEHLSYFAAQASEAVDGGYWSVDLLADRYGEWWLTDMADGDRSWRPE